MKNNLNEQLIRIKEIMQINTENEITEAGFSKVAQTLRGIVPSIKTIAIITAENPKGNELGSEENKMRNKQLKKDISSPGVGNGGFRQYLRSGMYGFRQIKGQYGNLENPFLINNISKDEALRLGKKYDQDTIIFGEVREQTDNNGVEMFFQLIKAYGDHEVEGTQRVFVTFGREGESKPQDFYSEVKGRKFVIPFYGIQDMIKTKLDDTGKINQYSDRERNYDDSKWVGGKNEPATKKVGELPVKLTPSTEYEWDKMHTNESIKNKLNEIVNEMISSQGSKAYNCRGKYKMLLSKYNISIIE